MEWGFGGLGKDWIPLIGDLEGVKGLVGERVVVTGLKKNVIMTKNYET